MDLGSDALWPPSLRSRTTLGLLYPVSAGVADSGVYLVHMSGYTRSLTMAVFSGRTGCNGHMSSSFSRIPCHSFVLLQLIMIALTVLLSHPLLLFNNFICPNGPF